MGLIISLALLFVGLLILILGADWLVKGASSIARRYGISPLVIGLTVVAFGTSMPELSVNIYAALSGATGLAVGNVVGSNIANILLVLGASAIICSLSVKSSTVRWEIPLALLASVLVLVVGSDRLLDGAVVDVITRTDGIVLLGLFAIFMFYIIALVKSDSNAIE
ncbi:MAG: sodium:calcium antiporter, partial [bacterium]|nr:sodium:calcium antiporter [bacterium]